MPARQDLILWAGALWLPGAHRGRRPAMFERARELQEAGAVGRSFGETLVVANIEARLAMPAKRSA